MGPSPTTLDARTGLPRRPLAVVSRHATQTDRPIWSSAPRRAPFGITWTLGAHRNRVSCDENRQTGSLAQGSVIHKHSPMSYNTPSTTCLRCYPLVYYSSRHLHIFAKSKPVRHTQTNQMEHSPPTPVAGSCLPCRHLTSVSRHATQTDRPIWSPTPSAYQNHPDPEFAPGQSALRRKQTNRSPRTIPCNSNQLPDELQYALDDPPPSTRVG
jgi:hypothetical protein